MRRNRMQAMLLTPLFLALAAPPGRPQTAALPASERVRILFAEDSRNPWGGLVELLQHPDAGIRSRAATAVGRIGSPVHVRSLELLLLDPVPAVRVAAAFGLGEIEDSTSAGSLERHLQIGRESDPAVRAACVEGLGKLGRGAAGCDQALQDPEAQVRQAALHAAWRIPGAAALDGAIRNCTHPDPATRRAAAYCLMRLAGPAPLGRTPTPAGAPIPEPRRAEVQARLAQLALEADPQTRIHATRGLSAFPDAAATEILLALRTDPDWRVRVEVARALARNRPAVRVKDLEPLLRDSNPNVCVAAVEALATVGPPDEARPKLHDLLHDRRTRIRQVAFDAFLVRERGLGDPLPLAAMDEIERATREMVEQKDWSLRLLAADGAVLLPIDLALPLLDRLIEDEPRVARAAVDPLLQRRARMRRDPILAQIGEILQRLLSQPDPVLRATTIESLGSIFTDSTLHADPSDWLGLQSILEQSRRYAVTFDRVPDVRLATVGVAGQFPARPEMAALLAAAAQDPEYLVRRAAVDAMRSAGLTPPREAEPVETVHSDSAYAAILSWAEQDHWAAFETAEGTILVRLFSREAPLTCWNFAQLAASGFFDRTRWHRVVPDFVLQAGCNRGDGFGGSERTIRCEINPHHFETGTLGMALSGKDTGTSQFFLTHSEQPHLDGRYTAFGQIEAGQEVADRLTQGANLWSIRVTDQRP